MYGRTLHRMHHFILAKLLKFQETFLEKFLVSGFVADSPNIQCTRKTRISPRFLFFHKQSEPPFQTLLQEAFCKKPLENPQKLSYRIRHFILGKAFEIPKDFSRKVLCVRVPRRIALTFNAHKKSTATPCFFIIYKISY